MNLKLHSNIKGYFSSDAWTALSDYEKRRYENVKENYDFMNSIGISAKMPEFMMSKFKRPVEKKQKTNDGHAKRNDEPKVKFKLFGVSKQISKRKISKKDVSGDIPVDMKTEPSSLKVMTKTAKNSGAEKIRNPKEFARIILSYAQDSLKELTNLLGGMDQQKDDTHFLGKEVPISEYVSTKGNEKKPRYPKRNITKKNYIEEDISSEDEFLFCDICNKEHKGCCPVHGPMLLVCNTKVPKGDSDRAKNTLPHFLSIGSSSIRGAGLGVWTEMPLVMGTVFGPYEGSVIKKNNEAKKSGYAWQVRKNSKPYHYVEGENKNLSNWMRYVNCADAEEWQNVVAFQYLGKIYYRTYKPVLPFTEILVWYGDEYGSELGIKAKEKRKDPPKEITGFSCEVCGGLFTSSEILRSHRKQHPHMQPDKRHRCPECSYSTDNTDHLRRHLLTHSGEKPHSCPHCKKRFTLIIHLRRHLLLHTGEKEHVCSTCGRRFNQKGHLLRHERMHSGQRPYRCPECGKDFTQETNLKSHLRLHTRQKPHPCPHCDRRFTQKGNLTGHISSIHTRVFPHNCPFCGKGFNRPGEQKKHAERCHHQIGKKG